MLRLKIWVWFNLNKIKKNRADLPVYRQIIVNWLDEKCCSSTK